MTKSKPEPGKGRPTPSRRLDRNIREAVAAYGWDSYTPSDHSDPDSGAIEDPLLRIVLLCRARSADWAEILKQAVTSYDQEQHDRQLTRHLVGDTPDAQQSRDEIYDEMASRLIDSRSLRPVDITEMGPITLAREVADGNIQVEYIVSNDAAFRERI